MSKVSVIIPIYNVEKYLARCLDSVINQTYKNLEIICVNDCSPDNSEDIVKDFAQKDNRIKIINRKQNGGLSAARNTGLDIATGEYVYFLDSDDWIDETYIEELVTAIQNKNANIIQNNHIVVEFKNKTEKYVWNRYPHCFPDGEFIEKYDAIHNSPCMIWSHLYKKDFLDKNNLRFPEGYIYEDEYFQYTSKLNIDKLFVFHGISKYHYRKNEFSIMNSNTNRTIDSIKIWKLIFEYIKNKSIDYSKLKLFVPSTVLNINDEISYNEVKKYLYNIREIYNIQKNLYNDCDAYVIDCILGTENYDAYKKRYAIKPQITYMTRLKLSRDKNIKVSIIVPVYNVEKYLRRCLDSLVQQTLRDIEIICVNDCSPDNSHYILKEYAKNDNRIKIIDFKENRGVAFARNKGMETAKGKYIAFIDSDDFVDLNFYEKLYLKAEELNADLVIGNVKEISESGKSFVSEIGAIIEEIKNNKLYFNQLFWLGLYKKDLLMKYNIKFIENCIFGEDRLLPLQASYYSKTFAMVDDIYYHYYRNQDSITKQKISQKILNSFNLSNLSIFDFLNKIEIQEAEYRIVANTFIENFVSMLLSVDEEHKEQMHNSLIEIIKKIKYNSIADINKIDELIHRALKAQNKRKFALLRKNIRK